MADEDKIHILKASSREEMEKIMKEEFGQDMEDFDGLEFNSIEQIENTDMIPPSTKAKILSILKDMGVESDADIQDDPVDCTFDFAYDAAKKILLSIFNHVVENHGMSKEQATKFTIEQGTSIFITQIAAHAFRFLQEGFILPEGISDEEKKAALLEKEQVSQKVLELFHEVIDMSYQKWFGSDDPKQ